jgi:predicted small lipoprotein YifL
VSFSSKTRLALTLAALVALAGCGRRGDLEPPSAAVASPTPENRHSLDFHRTDNKITPPKKDFALDPLLK